MKRTTYLKFLVPLMMVAGFVAEAGNIDVSTIPPRASVQLTVYNSEDLTLVRETRSITFKKGINPLQFSWANTLIDPSSVDLQFVDHKGDLELIDTTYPHDRAQLLEWNIRSGFDGEGTVQISYFTSGISWAADYLCIADQGETGMSFEGFVRIQNNSGEDYSNAQVRLVVGTINLVEKVAQLAQRGIISKQEHEEFARRSGAPPAAAPMPSGGRMALSEAMDAAEKAPKEIIKEGMSEYFIYTIEGTETVPNGWSKRLRLFEGSSVPFQVRYRWRPMEYGEQLVRILLLRNDDASKLGTTPLPDGIVRLFRDNGHDGLSFLSAQWTKYVPIGQEIEINLGVDPNVVHERVQLRTWRDNFWFRRNNDNRYFSPTQGDRVDPSYDVVGWNDHAQYAERIRNYRDKPINVEFRLTLPGDVEFESGLGAKPHDFQTVQFTTEIAPGQNRDLTYGVTLRMGYNSKQNAVVIREQ